MSAMIVRAMAMTAATLALGAAGAGSAGCGDGDKTERDGNLDVQFPDAPDTGSETSQSYSFVELCDGFAEAACKFDRCIYPTGAVSDEDCKKAVRENCEAAVSGPIGTYIDPGTIHYHEDKAGECFGAYIDATCEELGDITGDPPLACETAFEGTLAEGADCAFDQVCKPELFCKPGAGGTCPGTCAKRVALGGECNNDDAICQLGMVCGGPTAGPATCRPSKVESGGDCAYLEQCPEGEFCDRTAGHCTAYLGPGATCVNFGCQSGYYCTGDEGARTCQKLPVLGEDCPDYTCKSPAICIDGHCVAQPGEGDSCDNEFSSCGSFTASLQCDPGTKTCVPYLPLGSACGGPNGMVRCAGGYCTATLEAAGTCEPYKQFGDDCEGFQMCGKLSCEDGKCGRVSSPCRGTGRLDDFL